MALKSDSQGFLIGSPTDLTDAVGVLEEIRDLIRNGGLSSRQAARPSKTPPIQFIMPAKMAGSRSPDRDGKVATPRVLPDRDKQGRFIAGSVSKSSGIKTIEPAQQGWDVLNVRISKGDKEKNRLFRNIWKELNLFRQDSTVHDKAQEKALKGIEGSQGGEKGGGGSWMKYLLILPALYLLLTKTKAGEFVGNLVTKGLKNLLGFNDDPNATPEEKAAFQRKLEKTTFGAKVGGALGGVLGFMSPIPGGAALGAGLGAGLGGWWGSKSENPEKTVSNIGWGAGIGAGLGGALGFMSPIPGGAMMGAKLGVVAGGALGAYSEDFDKWVYGLMDTIGKSWNETAIPFFKTGWGKAMDGLKAGWDDFTKFAKDKWQAVSDAWGTLSQSFTKMLKDKFGIDLPAIGDGIGKAYANVKDAVKENAGMANAWIKQKTGVDVNAAVGNGIDNAKKAVGGLFSGAKNAYSKAVDWTSRKVIEPIGEAVKTQVFDSDKSLSGLNQAQTAAYAKNVAKTESSGNQKSVNSYGFAGKYQFGAEALAGEGLIDKEKLNEARKSAKGSWWKGGGHKRFMQDASNWKIEGGLESYLNNSKLQDDAFLSYTNKNIKSGIRSGALQPNDDPGKIAGYAKASHLKGVAGANKLFLYGQASSDAYGTSTKTYADQAARAVRSASITVSNPISPSMPTVSAPMPSAPMVSTPTTAPAEAPKVEMPTNASGKERPEASAVQASADIGQNLSDPRIAHIVTGGYARSSTV